MMRRSADDSYYCIICIFNKPPPPQKKTQRCTDPMPSIAVRVEHHSETLDLFEDRVGHIFRPDSPMYFLP